MIGEAEKELWKPGKLADRQRAIDDLVDVTNRMSNLVTLLTGWGLKDSEDEIRIKSARALGNIGFKARSAMGGLVEMLEKEKTPDARIAAAGALGAIFHQGKVHPYEKVAIRALIKGSRSRSNTADSAYQLRSRMANTTL